MALAGAEAQRNAEPDPEKRKYPGGAFDPVGLSKDGKARQALKPAPGPRRRVKPRSLSLADVHGKPGLGECVGSCMCLFCGARSARLIHISCSRRGTFTGCSA